MKQVNKKVNEKCVYYKISLKNFEYNFADILKAFSLKEVYVELYNVNIKKYNILNFLIEKNIMFYILNKSYDLCISVDNEIFEDLFIAISQCDYDEIIICDKYTNWVKYCMTCKLLVKKLEDSPIFFLDCNEFENNFFEITCDLKYNTGEIDNALMEAIKN